MRVRTRGPRYPIAMTESVYHAALSFPFRPFFDTRA